MEAIFIFVLHEPAHLKKPVSSDEVEGKLTNELKVDKNCRSHDFL